MNPAPVMELVEMIRGIATEDGTFGRTRDFVESLGKTVAVSEDFRPSWSIASFADDQRGGIHAL